MQEHPPPTATLSVALAIGHCYTTQLVRCSHRARVFEYQQPPPEVGASTGQCTEPCLRRAVALPTRLTEKSYGIKLWTMVVYRYLYIGHEQRETFLTVDFFSSTRRKPLPWWLG